MLEKPLNEPHPPSPAAELAREEREIIQAYDEVLRVRAEGIPGGADGPRRREATFDDMAPPDNPADETRLAAAAQRLHEAYAENVRLARLSTATSSSYPPGTLIERVRKYALSLGVSAVAYTDVPQEFIFSGLSIPFPRAFVFTQAMDAAIFSAAPHVDVQVHVVDVYGSLGSIANRLAEYIHGQGYAAIPNPALAGAVLYPPLAAYAGLGYPGRSGLLISPENGPCQRVGTVFVDLPIEAPHAANPHTWVDDFCQRCGKCIRKCPSGAIREIPEARPDGRLSCTDYLKCSAEYKASYSCGICVKVCPFTIHGYEKIKSGFL